MKTYIKKNHKSTGECDPVWFTKEMHENIKKRRHWNRKFRNAKGEIEKDRYKVLYVEQKNVTKDMIKKGITDYEISVTKSILDAV